MRYAFRCFLAIGVLGLVLAAGPVVAGPPAAPVTGLPTAPVVAHLFLVPARLPDGADAAPRLAGLEAWLAEAFGGYTRLGPARGGWKNERGVIETADNLAYLVTFSRDVSGEIAGRIARDFGERVPYVLTFPAGVFAP